MLLIGTDQRITSGPAAHAAAQPHLFGLRSALNKAFHRLSYYYGGYESWGIHDRSSRGLEFPGREDSDERAY